MKFLASATVALSGMVVANALSVPQPLAERDSDVDLVVRGDDKSYIFNIFEKRKGGGGRSSGGSSSSGSSSGSSRSGSSSSSSGGSSSSSSRTSNTGGTSKSGSGAPRSFGAGKSKFYGGGAAKPYRSGSRSPRGLVPVLLPLGIIALAFPGLWLYGAYNYGYQTTYFNQSLNGGQNQTRDVACLCQQYQVCGCDNNNDNSYVQSLIGTGAYDKLNKSVVRVGELDNKTQLLINGSLPNGTTAASWASGNRQSMLEHASWGIVAVGIAYSWLM